jgi:hypothetical protein
MRKRIFFSFPINKNLIKVLTQKSRKSDIIKIVSVHYDDSMFNRNCQNIKKEY